MDTKLKGSPSCKLKLTTETEHMLYAYYKEEQEERLKLASLVTDLKSQIEILQGQLKCLAEKEKSTAPVGNMETSHPRAEYSTDEEELARETEWIRTKARKKRKLNTSPSQDESNTEDRNVKEKIKKSPHPPPIIVDGIINYQKFFDTLTKYQPAETFSIKMMNGDSVKVNATNGDTYRAFTKILAEQHCLWHSYENKQERPIRVMAKKLHATCKPERIVEDLKSKGYKVIEAVNKLSWKAKEPLNMFMITFANDEDINKIYKIKTILGCNVEMQPLKTNHLIPQCKRCQAYGHTQKYCSKEPRCVKCTGKHHTKECQKPKEQKPKCVHCGAPHPANYRGCVIAKEIQQLRNKNTKKEAIVRHHNTVQDKINSNPPKTLPMSTNTLNKNVSYAQAVATSTKNVPQKSFTSNCDQKLDDILKLMVSFDERLKKIENSTKGATSKLKK